MHDCKEIYNYISQEIIKLWLQHIWSLKKVVAKKGGRGVCGGGGRGSGVADQRALLNRPKYKPDLTEAKNILPSTSNCKTSAITAYRKNLT